MIENDKQYWVTVEARRKFYRVRNLLNDPLMFDSQLHELLVKAQRDAAISMIDELTEQIKDYESKHGKPKR